MKRIKKLSFVLVLAFILATIIPVTYTEAAGNKPKIVTRTLWVGSSIVSSIEIENFPDNAKIISIKSSRPKVVGVDFCGPKPYDNVLHGLKPGKSKITIKYKVGKKTKTISAVFTVKAYPKAISSLKINGKKTSLKSFNGSVYVEQKTLAASVDLKPAKGLKIQDVYAYKMKAYSDKQVQFKFKNGKKFTVKKGYVADLSYTLINKKGETLLVGVSLYRK